MIREREVWLVATRGNRPWNGPVVALRAKRPKLKLGEVAVCVTLKIDDALFSPPTISCTIEADGALPESVRKEVAHVSEAIRNAANLDVKIFVSGVGK